MIIAFFIVQDLVEKKSQRNIACFMDTSAKIKDMSGIEIYANNRKIKIT